MGRGTAQDSPVALVGCGPSDAPKLESLWLLWLAAWPSLGL